MNEPITVLTCKYTDEETHKQLRIRVLNNHNGSIEPLSTTPAR